ncbi:MAG: Omp28-related outer membrane protein [Bacteroidia bacterium]|nr:Omp28-related outer membrane protein [Bacteroidia bacterium]MBP9689134.1 Omp28-related outer membrane protein [Bacteroidia bacterium]
MKSLRIILSSVILLTMVACEEVPPLINYEESKSLNDTTYVLSVAPAAEPKNVLLEDVSGVKCVNCPDAAIIAKSIMDAFPERVFTTVMHPNLEALSSFVSPITKAGHESKYDFRTDDAKQIIELCGIPGALPRGFINRHKFSDQAERFIGRTDWYVKCQEQMQGTSPVNIELTSTFNDAKNEGVLKTKFTYTNAVSNKQYFSIVLIEDSIIDVQEYNDPQTGDAKYNNEYVHMHVLRDIVTFAQGDPVAKDTATSFVPGRVFEKEYKYTMNVSDKIKVNPKHAKLLVFVHEGVPDLNILQVKEVHVK